MKMTLLGNRAFAEVIKQRGGHAGLVWVISPITHMKTNRDWSDMSPQ